MNKYKGYVVHNYRLPQRKSYLESKLRTPANFSFIEIENVQPEYMGEKYWGVDESSWHNKTRLLWNPPPVIIALSNGEIACTASHFYIYEKFLKEANEDWLVILEDDAVFDCDLPKEISGMLDDLPDRVDSIFIGGGFQHDAVSLTIGGYKNFLVKHHPATNTTVGYMLRRRMVQAVMGGFIKFDLPIDYELAYLLMINNALVLHMIPYLINEGSKFAYTSSISR